MAVFALRATRRLGRRGIFARAWLGLIANGIVICAAVFGFVGLTSVTREVQRTAAPRAASRPRTFEEGSARLERMQRTLDRAATNAEGDAALVAKASSEYVRALRPATEDLAAKTKMFSSQLAGGLRDVRSKEDLQARQGVALAYMEANQRCGEFVRHADEIYRGYLTNAGVSTKAVAEAVAAFRSRQHNPAIVEANHDLAEAQLKALQFLQTHWGQWSYVISDRTVQFRAPSLIREYELLSAEVKRTAREVQRLARPSNESP